MLEPRNSAPGPNGTSSGWRDTRRSITERAEVEKEVLDYFLRCLCLAWMLNISARFGLIDLKVESDQDTQVM